MILKSATASAAWTRYSALAMTLHWLIAALILIQIGLGWYMNEVLPDHSPAQDRVQDLHVSIGLTTLLFVLLRIAVGLAGPRRPFDPGIAAWERGLAHAIHFLFYLLMLALPLTGWALVSARHEPFSFWGLHWPDLPGMAGFAAPDQRAFRRGLQTIHTNRLIWITLISLGLHVAGALKHQFDGHPVLWRMVPFFKPPHARA